MQSLQRSTVATKAQASAALAPVRPAVAQRLCFKSAQQLGRATQTPRVVATSATRQISQFETKPAGEDPLVIGMDRAAQADLLKLPKGFHWYETMMILRPTMIEEERDRELAKFEAFLNKEECVNINALVRGSSRLAYTMRSHWEGIYVVYTYAARRQTAQAVQKLLSTPEVGSEDNVLRHITFCKH